MNVFIGLIIIGIVIFSIAFQRPVDDCWNKENTIWFFKHLILGIIGLFLVVTVGGC